MVSGPVLELRRPHPLLAEAVYPGAALHHLEHAAGRRQRGGHRLQQRRRLHQPALSPATNAVIKMWKLWSRQLIADSQNGVRGFL